jgi:cytochrome P450
MTGTDRPTVTLTRHADVTAALSDPRCVVPPLPAIGTASTGIGWLRSRVSRFSTGETHVRRRELVRTMLSRIDPTTLRRRAMDLGRAMDLAHEPLDLVPATALAEALGITAPVAPQVAVIARVYFPSADANADPAADANSEGDAAVDALVAVLSGRFDEASAATIGVLVQAHDATAALVASTLAACEHIDRSTPIEAILAETIRHDPPVRVMRRVCAAPYRGHPTGTLLVLDIAAANRDPRVFAEPDRFDPYRANAERHLTLGAGLRPCPGRDHAVAIAAGIVDAVR